MLELWIIKVESRNEKGSDDIAESHLLL